MPNDQFSKIVNILWISRKEMTEPQLEGIASYCERRYDTGSFSVKNYTDTITFEIIEKMNFDDYDVICLDKTPRFMGKIKEIAGDKTILYSNQKDASQWITFELISDMKNQYPSVLNNLKQSIGVIIAAFIVMSIALIPLFSYSRYCEKVSIIQKNLEHKLKTEVDVEDLKHLKNDIYLARCYTGKQQFNAYLYYDTSTVRIDEGSVLDTPVK